MRRWEAAGSKAWRRSRAEACRYSEGRRQATWCERGGCNGGGRLALLRDDDFDRRRPAPRTRLQSLERSPRQKSHVPAMLVFLGAPLSLTLVPSRRRGRALLNLPAAGLSSDSAGAQADGRRQAARGERDEDGAAAGRPGASMATGQEQSATIEEVKVFL